MTKFASLFVAASIAFAASAAASAAEEATATLRVDRGNVMTSQGGDFATAQTGQALVVGERLMVSEESAATVAYGDDCTRTYTAPGVYVVEKDCQKAGVDWAGAAKIVGGVAVGVVLLDNMEQIDAPPPVSR